MLSFYINVKKLFFLFILLLVSTARAKNIVPVQKPDVEIGKDGEVVFKENKKTYITPKEITQTTTNKKFITNSMEKKPENSIEEKKEESTKNFVTHSIEKRDEKEIKEEKKELLTNTEEEVFVSPEIKEGEIFVSPNIKEENKKEIITEQKPKSPIEEKKEEQTNITIEQKPENPIEEKKEEQVKNFVTHSIEKRDEKEINKEENELLTNTEIKEEKMLVNPEKENKKEIITEQKPESPIEEIKKEQTNITIEQKPESTIEEKKEELAKVIKSTNKQDEGNEDKKKIVITNDNFNKTKKHILESDINKESNIQNKIQEKPQIEYKNLPEQKVYTKFANDKVVKSTNYSAKNLDIISKIEQNLIYNVKSSDKLNKKIEITKGSWSNEDLKESVVKKDFKITKTSKKVEELNVEKTERDNKIASLKDQAYQAIQLKEYEIAIKLYKEVLRLNSKDNFTKLSLATTYHILGQYTQAKPIYIELLPVFPNSEQLISNLLSIMIQESPYEAIYLLPALANKYSNSAVIQAQTSIAFSSVERYDEAIKYIRNAIYLNENNIEYKYNLAVLYDITKNYNKAYASYKDVYNNIKSNPVPSISIKVIEERMKTIDKLIN